MIYQTGQKGVEFGAFREIYDRKIVSLAIVDNKTTL